MKYLLEERAEVAKSGAISSCHWLFSPPSSPPLKAQSQLQSPPRLHSLTPHVCNLKTVDIIVVTLHIIPTPYVKYFLQEENVVTLYMLYAHLYLLSP